VCKWRARRHCCHAVAFRSTFPPERPCRGRHYRPTVSPHWQDCLSAAGMRGLRGLRQTPQSRELLKLKPALRLRADDPDGAFRAVQAGLSVSVLPRWLVARDVHEGNLLRLLPELTLPSPPIVVVYPRRPRKSARKLLGHLAGEIMLNTGQQPVVHTAARRVTDRILRSAS
jgi:DNA-binding transcriptional LysR family regulator